MEAPSKLKIEGELKPMKMLKRSGAAGLAAMLLLLQPGCLERKEEIRVLPDGGLIVTHRLKGDPSEFRPGRADVLPSGGPWSLRDFDVPRENEPKSDHVREATARFADAASIPETFGAPGDPAPLRMRTTLRVEREGAVVRYVFERRYAPRAYGMREAVFKKAFPDDLRKALEKQGEGGLDEETTRRTVVAMVAFERGKALAHLDEALAAAAPDRADTRARLAARAAFERAFDAAWRPEALVSYVDASDEVKADLEARFRADTARAAGEAGAAALLASAERKAKPDAATHRAVEKRVIEAYEAARRVLDATEDLGDETFEVRVTFPAPVVLSDADALEDDGRTAVFRFGGEHLRDREQVLRAVAEGKP
jgi:hypothetical protein